MFLAQPTCARVDGAAIDRARFAAMFSAEPSVFDFVGATTHRAYPSPPVFEAFDFHSVSVNLLDFVFFYIKLRPVGVVHIVRHINLAS